MKSNNLSKRWAKARDLLHTKNAQKPAWQRKSEFRQSVGKVNTKSQAKKRKGK